MKKVRYIKASLWSGILGFLGIFSACIPRMEYGTPHATYIIKGKVLDSNTKLAIPNISAKAGDSLSYFFPNQTYTDAQGNFQMTLEIFPDKMGIPLYFWDADSAENKLYEGRDTLILFDPAVLQGGDGDWDCGTATLTLNISLNEKN
jgi:putative lipoprotein (rSAM/lipoprotein system)